MGSVMLPADSSEAQTILELARAALEDGLPGFDGAFHLEAFLTPEGPVFSEVGSRIGGGSIRSLRNPHFSHGFRCTRAVTYPDGRRRLLLERDLVGDVDTALIDDIALVDMNDFSGILKRWASTSGVGACAEAGQWPRQRSSAKYPSTSPGRVSSHAGP